MSANIPLFEAWEERVVCPVRGSRVVHYYLKNTLGTSVLAVIGTERSIRHMFYVVSDEFLQAYGGGSSTNACTKWRARREVVDWLASVITRHCSPLAVTNPTSIPKSILSKSSTTQDETLDELDHQANDSTQALESQVAGSSAHQTLLPDQMINVPRKLKVQNLDIVWSGEAWFCTKQLKHYPAFSRDETRIPVHSFVFIMAEDESKYLGYIEDLYEDKKGQKRVKVRWFHHKQEVMRVIPDLDPHPKEVFITPHVQVICAECIDCPAIVLTPKHYEKCLAVISHTLSSGIHLCYRQFKHNMVQPFSLTKLIGYSDQAILSQLECSVLPKGKNKSLKFDDKEEEEFANTDPVKQGTKKNRSRRGHQRPETGSTIRDSAPGNETRKCESADPKLKLQLPRNLTGIKFVEPLLQWPVSFKVHEKIELLCQDSGIRGCWFRCEILQVSQKCLKVQYADLEDVEGPGNLQEWVPASRVAAPDKLGMRFPGRQTIRPFPPEDSTDCSFKVGAAVDAWWSDGWWEGVVTRVGIPGNDSLQIYFPGEDKLLTLDKKSLRTSRDWVGNKWVEIKAKPNILHYLSMTANPRKKLSLSHTMAGPPVSSPSALLNTDILTNPRVETMGEDKNEPSSSAPFSSLLENVQELSLKKSVQVNNEDSEPAGQNNAGAEDMEVIT